MRKRNLWKAAGIMAAGMLTVSMAGGEAVRVYAGETKIAASADMGTEKEKSEKAKTVTPVLLLDKDGKPVIGPDGKPVYVTPTPAKENEPKNTQDASGTDSKEEASVVTAGEGQSVPAEGAASLENGISVEGNEAVNALPVPVPDAAESAPALAEMEAEASDEEISKVQEEIPSEVQADVTAEEQPAESAVVPVDAEETTDSYMEEDAAEEPAAAELQNTSATDPSASEVQEVSGTDFHQEDDRTTQPSGEAASSDDTDIPDDTEMQAADLRESVSDTADSAEFESEETVSEETGSDTAVSGGKAQKEERSADSGASVTVTSVRDLFATAVIPASTGYNAEEEAPSFSASLIGASAGEDTKASPEEEAKEIAESASASSENTDNANASASSENTDEKDVSASSGAEDASGEVHSGIPEVVVYEIEAVTEELAGPGTNQLVGNTDAVGTKTVTASQGSGTSGGSSGSSSYSSSSSGSGSSGSGSSGRSYQNTSTGTAGVRTANPKTGDTQKARIYFGTALASLAAIFKVMLETERAKRKIRK